MKDRADNDRSTAKTKKIRRGARGIRRVSTGCLTCKRRHKKCDEAKPACTQCLQTGWACDFSSTSPQNDNTITDSIQHLDLEVYRQPSSGSIAIHHSEIVHFEYFQLVCAKEFSLFFELPLWERLVLQLACTEPCMYHAALALGALSRSQHQSGPLLGSHQTPSPIEYATAQYSLAIEGLNDRLDASSYSYELAILASIVFMALEILQEHGNQVRTLLRAASAVLEIASRGRSAEAGNSDFLRPAGSGIVDIIQEYPPNLLYLADALYQVDQQLSTSFSV